MRIRANVIHAFLLEGLMKIGLGTDYANTISDGLIHATLRGVD